MSKNKPVSKKKKTGGASHDMKKPSISTSGANTGKSASTHTAGRKSSKGLKKKTSANGTKSVESVKKQAPTNATKPLQETKKQAPSGTKTKPVQTVKKQNTTKPSPSKKHPQAGKKSGKAVKRGSKNHTPERQVHKSETMKAVERQKKLENTLPMGETISQITSSLPVLGKSLDAPARGPIAKLRSKRARKKISLSESFKKALVVAAILAVLAAVGTLVIIHVFTVKNVTIEGNTHYTNEEIYDMVMGDRLGRNSIYLSLKYKNKDIEDIPFIETMNVKITDPSSIKIIVYEKAVAGYVEYMGRYFYFDKDGTVIESSDKRTMGIPQVMGLNFDHIILYEKLPVESDEVFKQILEMTQLLAKYDIEMDKLFFDKNYSMTLYFGDARIRVGDFTNIDEKIIRLKDILPELEGKKGVLRLDNYTGSDSIITFEVDK